MIFQLLAGIVIAAGVFAALLWSLYQSVRQTGRLRWVHILLVSLTILGMVSISTKAILLAQILGILMLTASTVATALEPGWNRVLTIIQSIFAVSLILRLPFVIS